MKKRYTAATGLAVLTGLYAFGSHIQATCVPGNADYEAGTGLSYRHNHNTKQQSAEPQVVGYSIDVINDEILQLRHALIDCGGDVLWDLAQKCREQQARQRSTYRPSS